MEEDRTLTVSFSKNSEISISYEVLHLPQETQKDTVPFLLEEVRGSRQEE